MRRMELQMHKDLQMLKELPKETKVKLRMMETWKIYLVTSLEEAELPDQDLLNL